jgi:hypothetical protein
MTVALLLSLWAGYVRSTHDPDPRWTDMGTVPIAIVFGFVILLYPLAGMVGNLRRLMLGFFFGAAAIQLIFFFVKG